MVMRWQVSVFHSMCSARWDMNVMVKCVTNQGLSSLYLILCYNGCQGNLGAENLTKSKTKAIIKNKIKVRVFCSTIETIKPHDLFNPEPFHYCMAVIFGHRPGLCPILSCDLCCY